MIPIALALFTLVSHRTDMFGASGYRISNFSKSVMFGGENVHRITSFPYMAFVFNTKTGTSCSATILSRYHVLTAAHCTKQRRCLGGEKIDDQMCTVTSISADVYKVFAGSIMPSNAQSVINVRTVYVHPRFKFFSGYLGCAMVYNVAILRLTTPFTFSPKINSITLSQRDDTDVKNCAILGWGDELSDADYNFILKRRLRRAAVRFDSCPNVLCEDIQQCWKNYYTYPEAKCPGDSGGPLICGDEQFGVISSSYRCNESYNIHTKVKSVMRWIKAVIY